MSERIREFLSSGCTRIGLIIAICTMCICPVCVASQTIITALTSMEGQANYIGGLALFLLSLVGTISTIALFFWKIRFDFGFLLFAIVGVFFLGLVGIVLETMQTGNGIGFMIVENGIGWTILAFAAGYQFFGKTQRSLEEV